MRRFQVAHIQVDIDGSGFQFRVPQHHLNVANVAATLQQHSGKCVAEQVTTAGFAQPGPDDELMHVRGQPTGMHAAPGRAEKKRDRIANLA